MTLKTRIQDDMKDAMRAKDAARLGTIRLLLAAIKQREVDERKDSITQFEAGKREDLAAAERAEIVVLQGYLPAQASEAEVDAMIAEAIAATGAAGPAGIGKVMAVVKPKLAGRADIGAVSAKVKARLA